MLALQNLNQRLIDTNYAVRGEIVARAQQLEKDGKTIIYCNIGNPQALGQMPLTYIRQTLALVEYPELLNHADLFPADIVTRAREILRQHPYGTGAYSQSTGIEFVRQAVADFITRRDGIPTDPNHIMLTDGASKGVQNIIMALLKDPADGIMIPIPQYPLYSATLTLYGGQQIPYHLDEDQKWSLNEELLEHSYQHAVEHGVRPVAITIINPGNPTGAVLTKENIAMIIGFAQKHDLTILADEVYQENIYHESRSFHSFAKIMHELGIEDVTLFSFHSVSKGYLGECGHRGGYVEMRNVAADVLEQLVKLQSINLCSNIAGQLVTYLMLTPPQYGEVSYALFEQERDAILDSLKERALILAEGLNQIEGVELHVPEGAMYAFVKFNLPEEPAAQSLTAEERLQYDAKRNAEYCLALLEETGICVVPGSGFGQQPQTLHFRITFLPPKEQIVQLVERFKTFHHAYVQRLTA